LRKEKCRIKILNIYKEILKGGTKAMGAMKNRT
jgi:hypothetical protein